MSFQTLIEQGRSGVGATANLTVVSNQDDGIGSYGRSDLLYNKAARTQGRVEQLFTYQERPVMLLVSDRRAGTQPFDTSAAVPLSVSIVPPGSGQELGWEVNLEFGSPFNRSYGFRAEQVDDKLVGETPAIGNTEKNDHAVWVLAVDR
jgi:hypothetical protein